MGQNTGKYVHSTLTMQGELMYRVAGINHARTLLQSVLMHTDYCTLHSSYIIFDVLD